MDAAMRIFEVAKRFPPEERYSMTDQIRRSSRSVAANAKTKLRLRLAKKALRAVRRTLKKHKKIKAKITVTAVDKAGNRRSQKAVIRLVS